jgi:hypothetical protein
LRVVDMGDAGAIIAEDLCEDARVRKSLGSLLRTIVAVASPTVEEHVGVLFEFANDSRILLVNFGDELTCFEKWPEADELGPMLRVELAGRS